jgi:glycine oxidase
MKVDYIIVGQGLAGSLMAYRLWQHQKTFVVIDAGSTHTSSHIAAGMFTPISGKRMVKSWMSDTLYPEMQTTYLELEKLLHASFLHNCNIQLSFASVKEQNDFFAALSDKLIPYVEENIQINSGLQTPFGAVEIKQSGWLNTQLFLTKFKQWLIEQQAFLQETFDYAALTNTPTNWTYKHLEANGVIFCEGYKNHNNPWFKHIPVIENKGDVFVVSTQVLDDKKIYKRGAYAVHLPNGTYKIGSTYKWNNANPTPDETGFNELKLKTDALLNGEYKVLQHLAGIRPTTKDRRPILGKHQTLNGLYMFNGLGTKGVLLAPYFSKLMFDLAVHHTIPEQEINMSRFE